MRRSTRARDGALICLAMLALGAPAARGLTPARAGSAQDPDPDQAPPVVDITGPSVIAFWSVPGSNVELEANQLLVMALDDQQYYWADTRDRLAEIGVTPYDQPGRAFTVRNDAAERSFVAHSDSADIGYVLVAPNRPMRVLYKLHHPDELITEATAYFGIGAPMAGGRQMPEAPMADGRQMPQATVASWLPLYSETSAGRLENENRVRELCADAEPVDLGACYDRVLAPSIEFFPLHVAPDSASNRVGELIVVTVPGRGFNARFRAEGSNETVPFPPDLYLQDWGYGPYFHQTVSEQRGAWFRLPRRPWPGPVWIRRADQLESYRLRQVFREQILEMNGAGWFVVAIEPDGLLMRPEEEADMWCEPGDPPPLSATEPRRFTRAQLVDEDGHLLIRPKYMKGC